MRFVLSFLLAAAVLSGGLSPAAAQAQQRPYAQQAVELLERLSPEQRIGQLFLVTFRGAAPGPDHSIFSLITEHRISGVVLRADYDNFRAAPDTLSATQELVAALQQANYQATLPPTPIPPGNEEGEPEVYIPLLIGVSQEGNGAPYSQIRNGVTELPASMAIGATWDIDLANRVAVILGSELARLGFNLLLGPSLDVLEDPRQVGQGDLGIRTFGGDPFWVSEMAQAYIQGLHSGSQGRLGVIAKHFPGLGGSDRPIEEEVATVRKSLVQLQQIELAPFIAVTGAAPGSQLAIADGLLTGHIRYQGFQGNIRATTRPIGLDPDAFGQLMAVEPFATWRSGGGITVSGALGSRAVRRFYESLGQPFRGHLVARDAFLAGNDLLYLADFRSDEDADQLTSILATLAFFTQKYRDDPVFAERVDASVLRILEFKLRLYDGVFQLDDTLPDPAELDAIGGSSQLTLEAARRSATLLSPAADALATQVGSPPRIGERIVFISDVRMYQQCSACDFAPGIAMTALEDTVNALYGTQAAGQVGSWNLTSLSMADLAVFLGKSPPTAQRYPISSAEDVDEVLRPADWLVFLTLKTDPATFGSDALKLMLDLRPDLARDKRVVVFAMDVPYDLDATEISKVDLFYALYGKTSPFIEVAARLLFQEISANGASPVSVPGIGYDLIEATSPDPEQLITLTIAGQESGDPIELRVGDEIRVSTGILQDHNGHPVPDGTPVEYVLGYQGDPITSVIRRTTIAGIATAPVVLDRMGIFTIQAESAPARVSEILQLNVQEGSVTRITPTQEPTELVSPTETAPPPSETPEQVVEPPAPVDDGPPGLGMGHLGLGLLGMGMVAYAGYAVAANHGSRQEQRVRLVLFILAGGLIAYDYIALGLPGSQGLLEGLGALSGLVLGIVGAGLGWGAAQLWHRRRPSG